MRGRRTSIGFAHAIAGLASIAVYHLPRIAVLGLQVLYLKARHGDQGTLTASRVEHLRRARRLLRKDNSNLLYAAIELRFALERLAQRDLLFNESTSLRDVADTSPVKKVRALRRVAPDSAYPHKAVLVNPNTGEKTDFGTYIPIDADRAVQLDGRLGDLLRPKDGLNLGFPGDPWYRKQRRILLDGIAYLEPIAKASPFSLYDVMTNVALVRDNANVEPGLAVGQES